LCRISSQKQTEGTHETEYSSGVAGRHCRRSGMNCMGLLHRLAAGSALRGDAETRIVPEGTALSAFHADLDCADICNVDSDRSPLRVGSRHRRPWTEDGSQNRNDRWILRRGPEQLRASSLVADSAPVAPRMDARPVDRLDLSRCSRRLRLQGVGRTRNEITRWRRRPALHLNSFLRFNKDSRPIRKHFRNPLHHFGCIVTGADDGVASDFRRVLQHQVERFGARSLA